MIQCWKDNTTVADEQRTWDAPYNTSAEQNDEVPYMYVQGIRRHRPVGAAHYCLLYLACSSTVHTRMF